MRVIFKQSIKESDGKKIYLSSVILISLTYSKEALKLVVEFLHQMASLKALFSFDCHLLPFLTPAFQKFSQSVAELKRSCLICHLDKFILAP